MNFKEFYEELGRPDPFKSGLGIIDGVILMFIIFDRYLDVKYGGKESD